MKFLKRIGNVIEGLVFIVLSLCLQSIFVILLTMAVLVGLSALGLKLENEVWQWVIFAFLLVTINALAAGSISANSERRFSSARLHR